MRKEERQMDAVEQAKAGRVITRGFSGQRVNAYSSPDEVADPQSQAALRQLSIERLMAYGVHHADAMELRGRVWAGESWQTVTTDLAQACLSPPETAAAQVSDQTKINRLYRASALVRMSQMMMLDNSVERSEIYSRAAKLFQEAAALSNDRTRTLIETPNGPLASWLYPSALPQTHGRVLMIGGVEGWAMDFVEMALACAARGLEVLALDGPGHGESRMALEHYLSRDWETSYRAVFDWLERREPALPFAMIGNSIGGSFAMHLASRDERIIACVNNGGTSAPHMARPNASFFQKMTAHVGQVSGDEAEAVWATVKPADPDHPVRCPLLVVHGGKDPLISDGDAQNLFNRAASEDKQMVVFSDGDHCIYNHADDKLSLICDWVLSRVAGA
jgi:alpha-beta hydrolase superfamily lysophospholipase